MKQYDRDALLEDFCAFYEKQSPPPAKPNFELPECWAVEKLDDLIRHEPETAWAIILQLLRQPLSDLAFSCLAAGPVEDLISLHGPLFVERIEAEAASNPVFRRLLGGVWRSGTAEIWSRIERVRGEVW